MARPRRETARFLLALLGVVALGLLSRLHPVGLRLYDKTLGDVLYAAASYLLIALFRPEWPLPRVGGAALIWCFGVEAFQLTGIPMRYARIAPVRWILGTTFAWEDLLCYLIGVALVLWADRHVLRRIPRAGGSAPRQDPV